jgi:ABC-type tungstate transport system substrate-binding protein
MFDQATIEMLLEGVVDTLYMTLVSTFFSYVFGMMMGTVLVICRQDGITPRPMIYAVLDVVVNLTRSFPFLILMIAVIPLTRLLVGTTIGNNATVVPLVIAAAPFVARLVESSLLEVDGGVIEAAQSMGASTMQIIMKVLLPEALPSLINGSAIGDHDPRLLRHVGRRRRRGPRQTGDHVRVQPLPDRHHVHHRRPAHRHRAGVPELRQLGHQAKRQAHFLIFFRDKRLLGPTPAAVNL